MIKDLMEKINNMLGDNNDLLILRGQMLDKGDDLTKPTKQHKEETGEVYYTFTIKTLSQVNEDAYSSRFNTYHCVMASDIAKKYSDEQISAMKGNEVIVLASITSNAKTVDGKFRVNNRNSVYVKDIGLMRKIEKKDNSQKTVVNL